MSDSFRALVEKLAQLHGKDPVSETISNQKLATAFSDKSSYGNALRVFNRLKAGSAESLNNEDRLEAVKLLKLLIPSISSEMVFNTISAQKMSDEKEKEEKQVADTSIQTTDKV